MSEPSVRAHIFQGFEGFASAKGLDFEELLAAVGLKRSDIENPDNEISINTVAELLCNAADQSGDPCFGLHWAEAFPRGGFGVLGYLLINSGSVRGAATAIARYTRLHLDPIDTTFEEADGVGRLQWRFPVTFTAPRVTYASFVMAIVVVRLRLFAGASWSPMGVELEHRELPCASEVLRVLGPNVRYNCPVNAISIRESVLDRTWEGSDRRLFELIKDLGNRLLAERRSNIDILERNRRAIVDQFETGDVTLETIADQLELSPRSLQAKLANEQTTFEALVQDTRQGLAEGYLRDTDLPMTEIAFLLGFSELSAFTRAAHRWFGVPPSAKRGELRRPSGSDHVPETE